MKKIERLAKQWLRERNVYFGKKIKDSELVDFLSRVRPYTSEHKLIRIGDDGDGGYLLPDDFDGISNCFSPGVSIEVHFEKDLANRGIKSFLADHSVDSLPIENPLFDFEKKFLGMDNDSTYMTLENWIKTKVGDDPSDMILEMDIEGAEYEVIFDTSSETLNRFRIIVIEFHNLDALLDKYGYRLINSAFRKIQKDFEIVHIHPNSQSRRVNYKGYVIPSEMEFTFLRKDRINRREFTNTFPHKLDSNNMSSDSEFSLPRCWYSDSLNLS
tara:strand:- start:6554 stop:7366 length:813 start_codon:yes stop_codon:yes gene_type:complete